MMWMRALLPRIPWGTSIRQGTEAADCVDRDPTLSVLTAPGQPPDSRQLLQALPPALSTFLRLLPSHLLLRCPFFLPDQ